MTTYQFKGKLLRLVTEKKRLPNGHVSTLEIIKHPGAVLIVPFVRLNEIAFVYQYRATLGLYLYELPAGTLNPNESLRQCALRELTEETGFETKRLTYLGKIFPVPGYSTEVISIFKGEQLKVSPSPKFKDKDEVIKVKILNPTEIKTLFKKGRITDAKTICGLAMCGII